MPEMREVLEGIYERIQERRDLEESEVTDVFTDHDFFTTLGYEGIPIDVRSENHIVGGDRPDYFAKDKFGNAIFVVEFKKPSRDDDLASHRGQLWEQYVVPLKAKFGVLTDGEELILYERHSGNHRDRKYRVDLDEFSDSQIRELERLRKPDFTFTTTDEVESYFHTADTVSVGELVDGEPVGRNEFLDTFRLEPQSLFYEMLEQTYELIEFYLEKDEGAFPQDAYEFWKKYYASDPSWRELPEEWREIAGSASNKQQVMFAVETVQSILGRLMLAKACEDYDFPNVSISEHIEEETMDFRGQVPAVAHIRAGKSLMQQMREELVESVFEQDIYYWWTEPAETMEDMSPREVLEEDWPTEVEGFGQGLVEFTIAMARFDFSSIRGDPLGELYQQYFDPKTRRALGEFYTPPSLTDYIIDSTGYGDSVQSNRLIDPACGSGTFLMSSLKRYKGELDEDELPNALQNLCSRPRIVGLDIHPFAVVLAQIRFMLEILEEYKIAIEQEPNLVLRRLPIFRTDSLLDESKAQEGVQQTLGATYGEGTIQFSMPLPVRQGGGFESMEFEFPRFKEVQKMTAGEIEEKPDYFSAFNPVFDAVKAQAADDTFSIERDELEGYFYDYFSAEREIEQIASAFYETANEFLGKVETLRCEYNDGRLLKLIEDVILGAILKNEIDYHYVVGNPPWVAKQSRHVDEVEERRMKELYRSAWRETDPYLQFMERGLDMLDVGGTLGFLVSNRYLTNQGGKEIRALLAKNQIKELIDFTDVPLFENATNYSSAITVEKQVKNDEWASFIADGEFSNHHEIEAARVREWGPDDIPGLVRQLRSREPTETVDFFSIDSRRLQERVYVRSGRVETEEVSESFDGPQGRTTATKQLPLVDIWPACPPEELGILDQIESGMDQRLGDRQVIRGNSPEEQSSLVGDDIRVGIQTNGDDVYIVHPTVGIDKEKLHELDHLTVKPRGMEETYTVETGLLKIDITGDDAARWLPDWSNRLVFIPYIQGDERARLITPTELEDTYPETWDFFTDVEVLQKLSDESVARRELHARLAAEFDIIEPQSSQTAYRQVDLSAADYRRLGQQLHDNPEEVEELDKDLWWYKFIFRKNIESLPEPKVLTGNQARWNSLSFDDAGIMAPHNARVYAIMADADIKYAMASVLNSAVVEFFHKQHARIHKGKAYSYIKDYTSKWPVALGDEDEQDELESLVRDILHLKSLEIKLPQFPDPFIAEARERGEEFATVSYTPSSSYTASPSIQSDLSESFDIEVDDGRIDAGAIDTQDKAQYVKEALDERQLTANESVSIPVPLRNDVAVDALDELAGDRDTMSTTDIKEHEAAIDDIVFDLYGIKSERQRKIINRYNSQHETVQSILPP